MDRRTTAAVTLGVLAAPMSAALFLGIGVAAAEPDAHGGQATVSSASDSGPRAGSLPRTRRAERSDADQRRPQWRPRQRAADAQDPVVPDARRAVRSTRQGSPREDAPVRRWRNRADADRLVLREMTPPVERVAPSVARAQVDDDGPLPSPPRRTRLLNVVGSLVLNSLVGLIHLADGPPVLPPNSTVTVRTSSLTLPIGMGRSVQADWYFPEDADDSSRLIYFQHGFLASGPIYSYTIARLAERTDSIVVAPSLSSNFFSPSAEWVGGSTVQRAVADLFVGDRRALTESASAAAGYEFTLPQKFVLVGHSAGGTLVTSVAGFLADNGAIDDLQGIVMLDGVEPAGSPFVNNALSKLRGTDYRPIYLISSDRYFWSRNGDMADKLQLARPDDFNGVHLVGGRHIDYMLGGNKIIQFAEYLTAGFSKPQNIAAAEILMAGWVNDLFSVTTSQGIYGQPGQEIPIPTSAGTANAVVLPLGYPARPVWNPVLEAVLTAILDFGGRNWFVYEPLPGHEVPVGAPASL
ncbi:MAG: alpha/beta hydrolase [Mycobacterium kyogaense]|uniref:alpha/beta hydrolase n=1 Tax=Mycobacterium kyogaense TaxID=2212479 RepID=UPI002FF8EAFE